MLNKVRRYLQLYTFKHRFLLIVTFLNKSIKHTQFKLSHQLLHIEQEINSLGHSEITSLADAIYLGTYIFNYNKVTD